MNKVAPGGSRRGSGEVRPSVTDHRLDCIDFQRPARFLAVCTCGWRSDPMLSAGLAGSLWDRHRDEVVPARVPTLSTAAACRELVEVVVPALVAAVRGADPMEPVDQMERLALLAATLGDRERRLAGAVQREWGRLAHDPTPRQRATVVVGLVELAERAKVAR